MGKKIIGDKLVAETYEIHSPISPSPHLVKVMRDLRFKVTDDPVSSGRIDDPVALARFLETHAGGALMFGLVGIPAEIRGIRRALKAGLRELTNAVDESRRIEAAMDVDPLLMAAIGLAALGESTDQNLILAQRLAQSVEELAALPVDKDADVGRPETDGSLQQLVNGIAAYFEHQGLKYSPARTRPARIGTEMHLPDAAHVTRAILGELGHRVTDSELVTLMRGANETV